MKLEISLMMKRTSRFKALKLRFDRKKIVLYDCFVEHSRIQFHVRQKNKKKEE
jgi:hypothetical protein